MNLRILLVIHSIIMLAAGMVLVLAPSFIPGTVEIKIQDDQFLLCYFLAAAEFALAYLSFYGRNITEHAARRIIIVTMMIFHASTFVLEVVALASGVSVKLNANLMARVVIVALFYYYGIHKNKNTASSATP